MATYTGAQPGRTGFLCQHGAGGKKREKPGYAAETKKLLAGQAGFAKHLRIHTAAMRRPTMKAKIIITPKKAVVDPQGKTVASALAHLGYRDVTAVHVGKYIEVELAPGTDKTAAQRALDDACRKFLSNPIIEDYKLEIE